MESQIKRLDSQLQQRQSHPRLRSTAVPHGATVKHTQESPAHEPVFEDVGRNLLDASHEDGGTTPGHFNEMGVRKYDLPGLLKRMRNFIHGPTASNPKLVSYLAAGGVQGLRPMRYEKRVARNRFIALATLFFLLLTGIIWWYYHNR